MNGTHKKSNLKAPNVAKQRFIDGMQDATVNFNLKEFEKLLQGIPYEWLTVHSPSRNDPDDVGFTEMWQLLGKALAYGNMETLPIPLRMLDLWMEAVKFKDYSDLSDIQYLVDSLFTALFSTMDPHLSPPDVKLNDIDIPPLKLLENSFNDHRLTLILTQCIHALYSLQDFDVISVLRAFVVSVLRRERLGFGAEAASVMNVFMDRKTIRSQDDALCALGLTSADLLAVFYGALSPVWLASRLGAPLCLRELIQDRKLRDTVDDCLSMDVSILCDVIKQDVNYC